MLLRVGRSHGRDQLQLAGRLRLAAIQLQRLAAVAGLARRRGRPHLLAVREPGAARLAVEAPGASTGGQLQLLGVLLAQAVRAARRPIRGARQPRALGVRRVGRAVAATGRLGRPPR